MEDSHTDKPLPPQHYLEYLPYSDNKRFNTNIDVDKVLGPDPGHLIETFNTR